MQFIFGRYHRSSIAATVDTMGTLLRERVSLRDRHVFYFSTAAVS